MRYRRLKNWLRITKSSWRIRRVVRTKWIVPANHVNCHQVHANPHAVARHQCKYYLNFQLRIYNGFCFYLFIYNLFIVFIFCYSFSLSIQFKYFPCKRIAPSIAFPKKIPKYQIKHCNNILNIYQYIYMYIVVAPVTICANNRPTARWDVKGLTATLYLLYKKPLKNWTTSGECASTTHTRTHQDTHTYSHTQTHPAWS